MSNESNTAGTSARREYERRRAKDEARIRSRWGRFGGIAVALSEERQSTRAWSAGAIGEELVGRQLDAVASDAIRVLHDRRIPGSRANIDHIVVTPGGVWVVDSKRYQGRRPALRVEGGLFRPRESKLLVGGRNQTRLVEGMLWQLEQVRAVLEGVPVRGALCFVDADWPLLGGGFEIGGVEVLWPRRLVKRVTGAAGELNVGRVVEVLSARFPAA